MDQNGKKFGIGWRGIFSLPISLLESGSDDPGCLIILALLLIIPELFLSYLKISSDGLEVRYWPFYKIHVPWLQIDHLGPYKVLGLIPSQAFYLEGDAPFGSLNILSREIQIGQKKRLIVLNDFHGWSNGNIKAELNKYIPEIIGESDKV